MVSGFRISIMNTLGQLVYLNASADLEEPVDISALNAGVYYLKIQSSAGEKTFKVFKE